DLRDTLKNQATDRNFPQKNFKKLSEIPDIIVYLKIFLFFLLLSPIVCAYKHKSRLRRCLTTDAALTKSPKGGLQATWLHLTLPKNLTFITPCTG
ncbi:MAG TPA: hypothetical protein VGR76_19615, partial [Candidatus Angelobacter sp.]|nr:hypothetical protein [Candidatus Angelobacter sp.]